MPKDSEGNYISEGCVVVDPYNRLWFIEKLYKDHPTDDGYKAKCKNSCVHCTWNAEALTGILYID